MSIAGTEIINMIRWGLVGKRIYLKKNASVDVSLCGGRECRQVPRHLKPARRETLYLPRRLSCIQSLGGVVGRGGGESGGVHPGSWDGVREENRPSISQEKVVTYMPARRPPWECMRWAARRGD